MKTADLIASILSHPSAQDKTPKELGEQINTILHQRRLLASTASPLTLMINGDVILDDMENGDSVLEDEFGFSPEETRDLVEIIKENPEIMDQAITTVSPEFDFSNHFLEEHIDQEIRRANIEIMGHLVEQYRTDK